MKLRLTGARLARPAAVTTLRNGTPRIAVALMGALAALTLVEPAFAQAAGIQTALENIISQLNGGIARALATLAVIFCGILAMFGAISMRTAGAVVLGIAIVFSASTIVGWLGG